jgi:hypothetical protein
MMIRRIEDRLPGEDAAATQRAISAKIKSHGVIGKILARNNL